ncbi:MAG TPA: hypothetical protein VFQ68_16405 [Streptosporangiaceae bacterium]|nr:hypothetical protein [Streptosporangiaceae bacterium]
MAAVLVVALVLGAAYVVSLKIWPETYCRRCEGGGRNAGSNRKRFGRCRACGGSGRKPRLGTRMITRRGG